MYKRLCNIETLCTTCLAVVKEIEQIPVWALPPARLSACISSAKAPEDTATIPNAKTINNMENRTRIQLKLKEIRKTIIQNHQTFSNIIQEMEISPDFTYEEVDRYYDIKAAFGSGLHQLNNELK